MNTQNIDDDKRLSMNPLIDDKIHKEYEKSRRVGKQVARFSGFKVGETGLTEQLQKVDVPEHNADTMTYAYSLYQRLVP